MYRFLKQVLILINNQIKKYNHVLYCQRRHGYLSLDVGVNKLALAYFLLPNDGFLNDAVSAILMFNPKKNR
ncbi:MAG: hypothetical protein RLZZ381_2472 [Cyanobacteriota bacterium]